MISESKILGPQRKIPNKQIFLTHETVIWFLMLIAIPDVLVVIMNNKETFDMMQNA